MENIKKVNTLADIKADPRIIKFIKNYDGPGKHLIECVKGYRFEAFSSTTEIGTIKELCYEINNRLHKDENIGCNTVERLLKLREDYLKNE